MHITFEQAVNDTLAQKKYDLLTGRTVDIRREIQNFIERAIYDLLSALNIEAPQMPRYNTAVLTAVFVTATAALLILTALFIYNRRKKKKPKEKSMAEIFDELKSNKMSFDDLMRASREYAGAGNYRESVRYAYIAVLWLLDSKGLLSIDLYKTNTQLKRELKENANELYDRFAGFVELFNFAWFGHKAVSAGAFAEFIAGVERFTAEVAEKDGAREK